MSGKNVEVPFFKSQMDAITWANNMKWVEEYLIEIHRRVKELDTDAWDKEIGWLNPEQRGRSNNMYKNQSEWLQVAARIMDDYKRQGIKGDVGASFMAYSIPLKYE